MVKSKHLIKVTKKEVKLNKKIAIGIFLMFAVSVITNVLSIYNFNYYSFNENTLGYYNDYQDAISVKGNSINGMLMTSAHEIGHRFYNNELSEFDRNSWVMLSNMSQGYVSTYAKTNAKEDFAESFAYSFNFEFDPIYLEMVDSNKAEFMKSLIYEKNVCVDVK